MKRFTQNQIDEANAASIIDYALKQGLQIKRAGKDYKIEDISGGLYIDIDKNRWHWWGEEKGGGPIQFVMEFEQKTWVEAIKTLLNIELSNEIKKSLMKEEKERPEGLQLPGKNSTMKHVFAYLTKSRGIDSQIVQEYVDNGLLYESKEKNCVFVGKDNVGQPAYAFIRGTNTQYRFMYEAENSKKEIGFFIKGETTRLFVFESTIDLMSYQTFLKINDCKEELKAHFLSLGGKERNALEHYLKENEIEKITLCLDNDEDGRKACQNIREAYKDKYKITRHKPHSKDFNADLTEMREQQKERVNEKNLEEEMELFSEP